MQSGTVFPEQWSMIVSASLAPVVAISACALMTLAFYNRLASIVARLRGFQRERMAEQEHIHRIEKLRPLDEESMRRRRILENLAEQTKRTFRRAKLIRLTLLCLLGTIGLLVISSIMNGISVVWPEAHMGAAILFISGMGLLLVGIACAIAELFSVLEVVESETRLVGELAAMSQLPPNNGETDAAITHPPVKGS
jgi:hypothetical protein